MKANIIAVDFDGTLCENKWPEIGMPNEELIEYLKKRQANGEKLILWTSRNEEQTKDAVEWCKEHGLVFDAVNDNLPEIVEAFGGKNLTRIRWGQSLIAVVPCIRFRPRSLRRMILAVSIFISGSLRMY